MRFRAKFGSLGLLWVSLALFELILYFSGMHSRLHSGILGTQALFATALALQHVLNYVFTYWEIGSESLRVRYFWGCREIPWREVVRVGGWPEASSNRLEIEYVRSAPMSDRGRVIANPEDRSGFLAALRRFAPQAEFADETIDKLFLV